MYCIHNYYDFCPWSEIYYWNYTFQRPLCSPLLSFFSFSPSLSLSLFLFSFPKYLRSFQYLLPYFHIHLVVIYSVIYSCPILMIYCSDVCAFNILYCLLFIFFWIYICFCTYTCLVLCSYRICNLGFYCIPYYLNKWWFTKKKLFHVSISRFMLA